jgi:hypothetical protein
MGKSNIEWRPVSNFENYEVSNTGQIRNTHTGFILKPYLKPTGYRYVLVRRGGRLGRNAKIMIHRAVLTAFLRAPNPKEETRHLNGNPADNRIENLSWGTHLENVSDTRRHGHLPIGERSGSAKLTEADVRDIRRLYGTISIRKLGNRFGVSHTVIRRAALGINWGHVREE